MKNWWKYQHYRDRRPPWIKIHQSILSDPAVMSLSKSDRWDLVTLWLRASDVEGTFPARVAHVRQTCGCGNDHVASCLLARLESNGLISKVDIRGPRRVVASNLLHNSAPETETYKQEREKEKSKKEKRPVAKTATFVLPDWIPAENWKQYLEMRRRIKKPMTDYAMKLAVRELEKLHNQGQDVGAVINQSVLHSWQGLFPIGGNFSDNSNHKETRTERLHRLVAEAVGDDSGDSGDA